MLAHQLVGSVMGEITPSATVPVLPLGISDIGIWHGAVSPKWMTFSPSSLQNRGNFLKVFLVVIGGNSNSTLSSLWMRCNLEIADQRGLYVIYGTFENSQSPHCSTPEKHLACGLTWTKQLSTGGLECNFMTEK